MIEPTYTQALLRAFTFVWRNKVVWIYGLLSVLLGQFGLTNFLGQIIYLDKQTVNPLSVLFLPSFWASTMSGWSLWLVVVTIALAALIILVSVAAEGALIALAARWSKHEDAGSLEKAWRKGVKHFWSLLVIKGVERALLAALLSVTGFLMLHYLKLGALWSVVIAGVVFAAGLLVALAISSVAIYASAYVVQDENSVLVAINKARLLFARHVLVSLELSIVQFLVSLLIVGVVILGGFWLLAPSVILTLIAGFTGFTGLITLGIYLTLFSFLVLIALLGGFYNAWVTSSWVLLFMKMHREGLLARVMHWFLRSFR